MTSPRTLFLALVGTGCVAAAGFGAYFAVRAGSDAPFAAAARPSDAAVQDVRTPEAAAPAAQPAESPAARPEPARATTRVERTPARRTEPVRTRAERTAEVETPPPALPEPITPATDVANAAAPEFAVAIPEPPAIEYEELTIPAEAVMGIRLDNAVSSETARVEDRVVARLVRDVTLDGRTVVSAGSRLEGVVTAVERGGKFRDTSRIAVRFTTLVLADKTRVRIETEPIVREGNAPGGEATAKVGGAAVIGTILGSVFGGKKGAAIGSAAGAAGGAAAVAAGDRNAAIIPGDTALTVRLAAPLTLTVRAPDRTEP